MAWTTPRTWVTNELVTAAMANTHIRDNTQHLYDMSLAAAFTPTWTATGTAPSLGNGIWVTRYIRMNDLVWAYYRLQFGTTTSSGTGQWRFTLPVTATTQGFEVGAGRIFDASTTTSYPCIIAIMGANEVRFMTFGGSAPASVNAEVGQFAPMSWADQDQLIGVLVYEAA
jgi:hypothetical protein